MGKSKNKKLKQSPETVQASSPGDLDTTLPSPVKAIDGHNTQGWTDSEIKAYNELIVERQKLEKQRHELEEKCAKSQTQRALLHENVASIDNLFKQQKTMPPLHKFTGSNRCCVEFDSAVRCHHEICRRAKREGVTDIELDTIKYYSMRIHAEKNERICNALRKQRDLELLRIKKEEDDGVAQSARKLSKKPTPSLSDLNKSRGGSSRGKDISKAAKETEKIVNKIINQLDDLRSDLQTGRISAEEAQGKLNILDSKLPVMQDKASHKPSYEGSAASMTSDEIKSSNDSFQTHLRERLLNAKGDTFSQAFSIMDHFLSATKPDELQEAIAELKDVLQLSGPMCDELQSSLGALEGIFDNPEKLSFTGPDGKQECNSIIDLMGKLKDTLKKTGQLPDGANASLTKVFQECIDLEIEAKEQLARKCADDTVSSADLPAALAKIKDENVAKSPIPPLTSNKLDSDIAGLLDAHDANQLLAKARSGVDPTALEAQITSLVILRAQKKPAKFVEKLKRLDVARIDAGEQEGSGMLEAAIVNVMDKMKKFVPASDIKKGKQPITKDHANSAASQRTEPSGARKKTTRRAGTAVNTSRSGASASTGTSTSTVESVGQEGGEEASKTIQASIEERGRYGLVDTFHAFAGRTKVTFDTAIIDKARSYAEKTHNMIEDQAFGIQSTISYLYKLKLCPGLVAVLISQALLDIAQSSENDFLYHIKELSGCVGQLAPSVAPEWSKAFQHIALAMIELYVASYVESMAAFPKMKALFLAMTATDMCVKYVLTTRVSRSAHENLSVLTDFLQICFGAESLQKIPSFASVILHYRYFCIKDKYRCLTVGPCPKHMNFARMPFNPQPVPSQSLRKQLDNQSRAPHSADKTTDLVPIPTDPKDTEEMEPAAGRHRIRPMKTILMYPRDHPNHPDNRKRRTEQKDKPEPRKRDVRYEEALEEAAILYVQTARRAEALNTFQPYDSTTLRSPSPAGLLAAITNILSADEADLDTAPDDKRAVTTSVRDKEATRRDVALANSKFSEHLDEPRQSNNAMMAGVLNVQNIFKQIRSGNLGVKYLESVVGSMKDRALSGQHPNPIEAITEYANALVKVGKIPHSLQQELLKAQDDLQIVLEDGKQRFSFETRRLKHLLYMVEAEEPSISAMFKLARRAPSAFHEYYEIISDRLEETETSIVEMLEHAWSDVTQLVKAAKLRDYSPSLVDFVRYAVEDWSQRPRELTGYMTEDEDNTYASNEEESGEIVVQEFDMDEPSLITKSPARQAVLERKFSVASAVASQASISSPDQLSHVYETEPVSEKRSDLSPKSVLQSGVTLIHAESTEVVPEKDEGLARAAVPPINEKGVERVNVQYARDSPEPEASTSNEDTAVATTYKQPSENMRNMFKAMKKLQGNARGMFETADFIGGFNEDHGKAVHGVAEKLAQQVALHTELVAQFAEWNQVKMPEDLNEFLDEQEQGDDDDGNDNVDE